MRHLYKIRKVTGNQQSRSLICRLAEFWSVLLIISMLMSFSIYSTFTRQIYTNMNEIMSNNIKFAESTYGVYVSQMTMGMLQASVEPGIRELINSRDGQALYELMIKWGKQRYYVDEWYAVDKNMNIIASYSKTDIRNLDIHDITKEAFGRKAPILGTQTVKSQRVPQRDILMQYSVVPISDGVGNILGALITGMNMEYNPNIPDKIFDEAGMYTVISAKDQIISCNFKVDGYQYYFNGEHLPKQVYDTIKDGKVYISKLYAAEGKNSEKQFYSAFRPIKDIDGKIIGSQGIIYSDSLMEATLKQIVGFTVIIELLLVAIFSIIVWTYFRINKVLLKEKQYSHDLGTIKRFSDIVRQATNEDDVYEILLDTLKTAYRIVLAAVVKDECRNDMGICKNDKQEPILIPVLETDVLKESCPAIKNGNEFLPNAISGKCNCKYFCGQIRDYICLPIIIGDKAASIIQLRSDVKDYFTPELVNGIKVYIDIIIPVISNLRLVESLNNMASTDTLTEIYNRRYLATYLREQMDSCQKHNRMLSIIMMDIDFFKKFNDTYGHEAGDYVLKQFASTIKKNLRMEDIVTRYGGEEFLTVLPNTDIQEAYSLAERIREEVEKIYLGAIDSSNPPKVTCSLGISCYPAHSKDPDKLIQAADKALYEAKKAGRNNTKVYKIDKKAAI